MNKIHFNVIACVILLNIVSLTAKDLNAEESNPKGLILNLMKDFFHIDSQQNAAARYFGINIVVDDESDTRKTAKLFLQPESQEWKPKEIKDNNDKKHRKEINHKNTLKSIKERISYLRNIIKRRNQPILGVPRHPEDLPAAEAILPGHTLLRPAGGMLKSAVKYPLRDVGGSAVYGNSDNVGITWGKTGGRIRYSNFRKANNLLSKILSMVQDHNKNGREKNRQLVVIKISPPTLEKIKQDGTDFENQVTEDENDAIEVLNNLNELPDTNSNHGRRVRRSTDRYRSAQRRRGHDNRRQRRHRHPRQRRSRHGRPRHDRMRHRRAPRQ